MLQNFRVVLSAIKLLWEQAIYIKLLANTQDRILPFLFTTRHFGYVIISNNQPRFRVDLHNNAQSYCSL